MTTVEHLERYISRIDAGEYERGAKAIERDGKAAIARRANAAGVQACRGS